MAPSPALRAARSGAGALEALREPDADSRDRWLTCNMEYGKFYGRPDASRQIVTSRTLPTESYRPQTAPDEDLQRLHVECERKWELLAKQLEECRGELEHLRVQKQDDRPGTSSRGGRGESSGGGNDVRRNVASKERKRRDRHEDFTRNERRREDLTRKEETQGRRSPRRVINIRLKRGPPSPDDLEDKCDRCKMLDDEFHEDYQEIHPETSKYNYYKYYGFAGHGAKTSWGHNYPLGYVPPYALYGMATAAAFRYSCGGKLARIFCLEEVVNSLDHELQADFATFASLLQACSEDKDLVQGKRVHEHLVKRGYDQHTGLGGFLVQMYSKCGNLGDAQAAFDRISEPSVLAWNILIGAYVQAGCIDNARSMFERVSQPNAVTWTTMVKGYAQNGDLDEAWMLFERMPARDVVSWTTMINAYAQTGHIQDGREVFDKMPQRDLISWNAMVAACAQNGCLEDAKVLFDEMPNRNVVSWNAIIQAYAQNVHPEDARTVFGKMPEHSVVTWTTLMSAYALNGQCTEARSILNEMPQSNVVSWTIMMNAYAHNGHLEDAKYMFNGMPQRDIISWNAILAGNAQNGYLEGTRSVFDKMPETDIISWTTMITAYAYQGHLDDAQTMFNKMPQKNSSSWNILITSYAQNGQVDSAAGLFSTIPKRDLVSWNAIVAAYAQNGHLETAKNIFDKMPQRDVVTWTSIIDAYVQNGRCREAIGIFRCMDLEGFKPNHITYISILEACSTPEDANLIRVNIISDGLQPVAAIGTGLVSMYGKCGQLEDAKNVFDKMVVRDAASWTAMIAAYAWNGHAKDAFSLFQGMQLEGMSVDKITFVSIIFACSHMGLLAAGRHYFLSIEEDHGLRPTVEHYICMIDLFGRAGQVEAAEDLLSSMPCKPDVVAWVTLLAACGMHGFLQEGADIAM